MKAHTRAEQRHLDRIGEMSCIACELLYQANTRPEIHHIREGRQARNHFLTLPMCPNHHRGPGPNVHTDKASLMRQLGVNSEFDLLALVLEKLA